jgi:DNA anti-recombination protein RmuC
MLVKSPDPISEKIIKLVSKYNALDECMAAVKKGFEKNAVNLNEFLKIIRQLSEKQCKIVHKLQKIRTVFSD